MRKAFETAGNTINEILSSTTYMFLMAAFIVVTVGMIIGKLTAEQWKECFEAITVAWTARGTAVHFSKDSDSNMAQKGETSEPADN